MKIKIYSIIKTYEKEPSDVAAKFADCDEALFFFKMLCDNEQYEIKKSKTIALLEFTHYIDDKSCELVEGKVLHTYLQK